MVTKIALIDRALVRIGQQPVKTDKGERAEQVALIWDAVYEDLASEYSWTFATRTRPLARLTAPPDQHWEYAFQLPADRVGPPIAVYDTDDKDARPFKIWDLQGDRLLANKDALWATFTIDPEPLHWPGYFREIAVLLAAAEYALSEREDAVLRDRLRTSVFEPPSAHMASKMQRARSRDAQSKPSKKLDLATGVLVRTRWS